MRSFDRRLGVHAVDKRRSNTVSQRALPRIAALEAIAEKAAAVVLQAHAEAGIEYWHRDKKTRALVARGYPPGQGWRYFLSDEMRALEAALAAVARAQGAGS